MGELVMIRAGGAVEPDPDPPPDPPPGGGGTYITSQTEIYQMPTVPLMARGGWYTDANFGPVVTKRTGPTQYMGPGSYALIYEYSRYCPVSKDGTYITLINISTVRGYSYFWGVFNRTTGALLTPWMTSGGSGDPEFNWDITDDTVGYFHKDNAYWKIDMPAGTTTRLFTVTRASGVAYPYMNTKGEGRASDDNRWHGMFGRNNPPLVSTNEWIMYDRLNNSLFARIPAPQYADWVGTTPLTGQFICGGDAAATASDNKHTNLYDRNLNFVRRITYQVSHGDLAIGSDGDEYWVYKSDSGLQNTESGGSGMCWARISDGVRAVVPGFRLSPRSALHISGICSRAHPDWVLMSHYSSANPDPFIRPGEHEVWFLNFKTGDVKRVCHTHNIGTPDVDKDYFAETQAVTDWSGNRVFFKSNFGTVDPNKEIGSYELSGTFW
jgi:hypothetical protein